MAFHLWFPGASCTADIQQMLCAINYPLILFHVGKVVDIALSVNQKLQMSTTSSRHQPGWSSTVSAFIVF